MNKESINITLTNDRLEQLENIEKSFSEIEIIMEPFRHRDEKIEQSIARLLQYFYLQQLGRLGQRYQFHEKNS